MGPALARPGASPLSVHGRIHPRTAGCLPPSRARCSRSGRSGCRIERWMPDERMRAERRGSVMRKGWAVAGAAVWFAAGSAVAAQDAALGLGAPVNMGRVVNSGAVDTEPTFSSDGSTMYFSCHDRRDPRGGRHLRLLPGRRRGVDGPRDRRAADQLAGVARAGAAPLTRRDGALHHERPAGRDGERRHLGERVGRTAGGGSSAISGLRSTRSSPTTASTSRVRIGRSRTGPRPGPVDTGGTTSGCRSGSTANGRSP